MNTELHQAIMIRLEELYMEDFLSVDDFSQAYEEVKEQLLEDENY